MAYGVMSETELQDLILAYCKTRGVLAYHTYDSRRSTSGFLDLVLVGSRDVLYVELKSEKGKVSPEQQVWIDGLTEAGQHVQVWRPRTWHDGTCVKQINALGRRAARPNALTQDQLRKALQKRSPRRAETSGL